MAIDRYVGIAIENDFGSQVMANRKKYIDSESADLDAPGDVSIMYEGMSQRAPLISARNSYSPEGSINLPLDVNMIGVLLYAALGEYYSVATVESGAYRHTFRPANEIPSLTIDVGKDYFQHTFIGSKINTLEVAVEKGDIAKVTASINSQKDKTETLLTSPDLWSELAWSFSQATVSLGGTTKKIKNFSLSINNNLSVEDGTILGSVFPDSIPEGKRDIELNFGIMFESTADLKAFYGGAGYTEATAITERAVVLTLTGGTIGATSTNYSLTITIPAVIYQESKQPVSGRTPITQNVKAVAMHDSVSGYQISAALVNAVETYDWTPDFKGLVAYDANKAWVVGYSSFGFGSIDYTADAGATWSEQNSGISSQLNAVSFYDASNGMAVGNGGVILETSDGGTTWTAVTSGVTKDLYSVDAVDSGNIFICGQTGTILKYDGTSVSSLTSGTTEDLHCIRFRTSSLGICVGTNAEFLVTTDGSTWTPKNPNTSNDLYACAYSYNNPTQYMMIAGASGVLETSSDGGNSWTSQTSNLSVDILGLDNYDHLKVIGVGADGGVFTSADWGATCVDRTITDLEDNLIAINGVSFPTATVAFFCSDDGWVYSTDDAGATWTAITD